MIQDKGASKALWVIAIVLVIFLIGGIVLLWGMGEAEEELRPATVEVTVLKAERRKGIVSNTYVQIQMKNTSQKKDASLGAFYFSIETDVGGKYDGSDMEGAPDKLTPGGKATFWVGFDVKEGETPVTLHYEPMWAEESFKASIPELTGYKPEATVTVSKPTDHKETASIKVSIEGEKSTYSISLTGPDGTEVGSGHITEDQMADGKQAVWVSMTGYESNISADPGKYSLTVTDSWGNKVHEEESTYSGADLTVETADLTWEESEYMPSYLSSVTLTVSNDGDLPGYVTGVEVSINGNEGSSTTEQALVPVGETVSIEAGTFLLFSVESGTYTATFELREGLMGQEETVVTYTKDITVP